MTGVVQNLIVDIGMSEGNDTEFYLKKGFRVLGVEADPAMCSQLQVRFSKEIMEGRLKIVNRAAYEHSGEMARFLISDISQGRSRIVQADAANGRLVEIETISWPDIVAIQGVPYYCKIDVEGAENALLRSMAGDKSLLPEYTSVECHNFDPIEGLYQCGYRKFRIIHQNAHNAFSPPNPPLEGNYIPKHNFVHSSGYFGKELYGRRWLDFREIAGAFDAILRLRSDQVIPHIWFDCHAYRPSVK